MKFIMPASAMICTVVSTLTAVVFCMGMGANASPSAIRQLKMWMIGIALLSVTALIVAAFLMRAGHTGRAAGVAFAPTAILGILFLISVLK